MSSTVPQPMVLKDSEGREWTLTITPPFAGSTPQHILKSTEHEIVIYGPASVEIVDREGDRIAGEALNKALPQLIRRARFSLQHVDILPGEILASFKMDDGTEYNTEVRPVTKADLEMFKWLVEKGVQEGDQSLFCVGKVWSDTSFSRETQDAILKGELNSFSISGQATAQGTRMVKDGFSMKYVNEITGIDLSAVTICKEGMNQAAKFVILRKEWAPIQKGDIILKPFESEAQRRMMHAEHPEIADRWEKETPDKKLPQHVKKVSEMDLKLKRLEQDIKLAELEERVSKSYWVPDGTSRNGQPKARNPQTGAVLYGDDAVRALQTQTTPTSESNPNVADFQARARQQMDNKETARGMAQQVADDAGGDIRAPRVTQVTDDANGGQNLLDEAPLGADKNPEYDANQNGYERFASMHDDDLKDVAADITDATADWSGHPADIGLDNSMDRLQDEMGDHVADRLTDIANGPESFEDPEDPNGYVENPTYEALSEGAWGHAQGQLEEDIEGADNAPVEFHEDGPDMPGVTNWFEQQGVEPNLMNTIMDSMAEDLRDTVLPSHAGNEPMLGQDFADYVQDTLPIIMEQHGYMAPDMYPDGFLEEVGNDLMARIAGNKGGKTGMATKAMPPKDAKEKPLKLGNPAQTFGPTVTVAHNADGQMKKPTQEDLYEYPAGADHTKDAASDGENSTGTRPKGFYQKGDLVQKNPALLAALPELLGGGAAAAGEGAAAGGMGLGDAMGAASALTPPKQEDQSSQKGLGCTCNAGMGSHAKECPMFNEGMPSKETLIQKPGMMPADAPGIDTMKAHPIGPNEHRVTFAVLGKAHLDAQCVDCRRIAKQYDDINRYFNVMKESVVEGVKRIGFLSQRDLLTFRKEYPVLSAESRLLSLRKGQESK